MLSYKVRNSSQTSLIYCTKSGNSRASFRYPPYPILWIGLRRIALLAVTQFTFASFTGLPPSWNVSGKKYGKNLPSVYFTFLISLNRRRVAPFPTLPTTASSPIDANSSINGSMPIQWSPMNIIASFPYSCTISTISLASFATSRLWNAWKSLNSFEGIR